MDAGHALCKCNERPRNEGVHEYISGQLRPQGYGEVDHYELVGGHCEVGITRAVGTAGCCSRGLRMSLRQGNLLLPLKPDDRS